LELRVNGQRALRLEPTTNDSVSVVGGWGGNFVGPGVVGATIGGGGAGNYLRFAHTNSVQSDFGVVAGGAGNVIAAYSPHASIAGGWHNAIATNAGACAIGGGVQNTIAASAAYSAIAGGYQNAIGTNSVACAIGGGSGNRIAEDAEQATIAGGTYNTIAAGSWHATIAGGYHNAIGSTARSSTIGGGEQNSIQDWGLFATIGGGSHNTIAGFSQYGTVAGGCNNAIGASSRFSAIGGGLGNTIADNAPYAAIPGGTGNFATSYAFAAGRRAKANHIGAFVWGDSTDADIASDSVNSVTMRASGGYRLFSNTNATTGVRLASGGGSWTSICDRNAKENFAPVDVETVLAKVVALPIATWNYKSQDPAIRHMGPTAQDFKAAFGLGESDTGITTIDADGVALAAIQGLNRKLEAQSSKLEARSSELEARSRELEQKNAALERQVAELKALLQALANKLSGGGR
jgi:hypothetical protein